MEVSEPLQETGVLNNQRLSKSLETDEYCLESGEIVEDGGSLKVMFKPADELNDGISGQHTGCGESESLACTSSKFKNGLDKYVFVHGNGEDQNPPNKVSRKSKDACVWDHDDQEPGDVQTNELEDRKPDAPVDDKVSEDVKNENPESPFLPIHRTERNERGNGEQPNEIQSSRIWVVSWHNLSQHRMKIILCAIMFLVLAIGCILGVGLNPQSDQPSTGGMDNGNNKTWTWNELNTTENQPVLPSYQPEQPEEDKGCKTVIMTVEKHSQKYGSYQICKYSWINKRHQCEVEKKHWSCVPDHDNKWFGICTLELPKKYHIGKIECCCPIMSQKNLEAIVMYNLCPCGMNNQ